MTQLFKTKHRANVYKHGFLSLTLDSCGDSPTTTRGAARMLLQVMMVSLIERSSTNLSYEIILCIKRNSDESFITKLYFLTNSAVP